MTNPLRLMIFDKTCKGLGPLPGLSTTWKFGAKLFGALDRLDASFGASTWEEALGWLADYSPDRKIAEIQYWGHGNWGQVKMDGRPLDHYAFAETDPRCALLKRIRTRLTGKDALWWFRTCETFGTSKGHDFARAWSRFFDCRVAGHTYVIWVAQSGLHVLEPGAEPDWSVEEGLPSNKSGADIARALWSDPFQPNTVSFLAGKLPK